MVDGCNCAGNCEGCGDVGVAFTGRIFVEVVVMDVVDVVVGMLVNGE